MSIVLLHDLLCLVINNLYIIHVGLKLITGQSDQYMANLLDCVINVFVLHRHIYMYEYMWGDCMDILTCNGLQWV